MTASKREGDQHPAPITIVLAGNHQLVRDGLRMLLDAQPDLQVLAEAGDVADAERRVAAHRPRILVLDLHMPWEPVLQAIPRIRKRSPATDVVLVTMAGTPTFAAEALRAGASGYVLKESAGIELVCAVRVVSAGGTYLVPSLGSGLHAPSGSSASPDGLSQRELEVLRLIALGHTNRQIAERLRLSLRTVESHRASIQRKTGRRPRAELFAYARERGLV